MAVKVIVPNTHYNAVFLGVQFKDGVGIFEDEELAKNIAQTLGYKVEPIEEEKAEAKKAPEKKSTAKKSTAKKAE